MATAIATAPLDVLRTRLQSETYSVPTRSQLLARNNTTSSFIRHWFQRLSVTARIIVSTQKTQGWRGLYSGLGPSIIGVVLATAIKFYAYGNCKRIYAELFQLKDNVTVVHMAAAATAGIVTGTQSKKFFSLRSNDESVICSASFQCYDHAG